MGEAGLGVSPAWKPKATEDELFSNMAAVWEKVGRQPKQSDFRLPDSNFSADVYVRRYGSWRRALEIFVAEANSVTIEEKAEAKPTSLFIAPPSELRHCTPREPGWRLRYLVMRRDRFSCQYCGKTPALDSGVILHIDHKLAWSKGGETTMDNLQTLCEVCNIGKGDLSINDKNG